MVKQRRAQQTKVVQTKRNNKRNDRKTPEGTIKIRVPNTYPKAIGDVVPVRLRASILPNTGVGGFVALLVVLGTGVTSATYIFADDLWAGFGAMASVYSRFIITKVRANLKTTTSAISSSYVGMNFEASNSTTSGPPVSIGDVTNSVHFADATAGSPGELVVAPTDYYNDWRTTNAGSEVNSNMLGQMGVLQIYATGPASSPVAIIDIEIDCLFAGYFK